MKKLTGKGKHIIKVGNHPHIKLVGRLKDKSSKIICILNKQLRNTQEKKWARNLRRHFIKETYPNDQQT